MLKKTIKMKQITNEQKGIDGIESIHDSGNELLYQQTKLIFAMNLMSFVQIGLNLTHDVHVQQNALPPLPTNNVNNNRHSIIVILVDNSEIF